MEFRDLKKQYQVLREEMDRAVLGAMSSGAYIMGPHWGIGPGDAVFVPDFTFFSSAEVVPLEGATPVFVDVCEETFNIDAVDLERAVKEVLAEGRLRPRVVVAVDLFGLPADYQAVRAVADRYGLLVLEDGAQCFGGSIDRFPVKPGMTEDVMAGAPHVMAGCDRPSKRACSFGDIATTSFFPAKPLGCYGDGGAVFTDNNEWASLIASYRVHGKGTFKYDNVRIGLNSRLDTLQAAVLQVKLKAFAEYELDDINVAAEKYTERLKDIVATPVIPAGFRSSWAQYTIKLQDAAQRDALQAALKAEGIPSMVYYPKPLHLQTAFVQTPDQVGGDGRDVIPGSTGNLCPVATSLCSRVLSLPLHPYITEEQIDTVCNAIRKALR